MTLTDILTQVSEGKLSVADAEALIRSLAPRRRRRPRNTMISAVVLVLAGAAFAGVGAFLGFREWSFRTTAEEAEGTVIRHSHSRHGASPIVKYEVDGTAFQVEGKVARGAHVHAVGAKVPVYYLPDHPKDGRLHHSMISWLGPLAFGGVGFVVFCIGVKFAMYRVTSLELQQAASLPSRDEKSF